jgi:predicted phosphodiesterase
MRIAVLSDVHGNLAALDAVLAETRAEGVTAYWVLGDLVAYGPRPAEVVECVRGLPGLRCVRGNTDRYVLTGDVGGMIPAVRDPALLGEIHASLAWTRTAVAEAGHEAWLDGRPTEERSTLEDGTGALLVHASPGRDDGPGAQPRASDDELATLGFTGEVADLVLVGHTHLALDRRANGTRIVNPGPVSLPPQRDGVARWALVTTQDDGYDVEPRRTPYDIGDVLADLHRVRHPAAAWIGARLGVVSGSH